jgi:hypothetical protein
MEVEHADVVVFNVPNNIGFGEFTAGFIQILHQWIWMQRGVDVHKNILLRFIYFL